MTTTTKTTNRPKRLSDAQAKAAVDKWNERHPAGTPVRYWKGVKDGEPSGTAPTRGEAFVVSGPTPVVFVEGCSGYVALTHVEAASAPA